MQYKVINIKLYQDQEQDHESLSIKVWNRTFSNPIGLAAGFDKNAEGMTSLLKSGFGFVEIGSVTPLPQV